MEIQHIRTSQKGNRYTPWLLKTKDRVVTKAVLCQVAPESPNSFCTLKLGRYLKATGEIETGDPKSELTLDGEELDALVAHLAETLPAMREGAVDFISLDSRRSGRLLHKIKDILRKADRAEMLEILCEHDLVPSDLLAAVTLRKRQQSLEEFSSMLDAGVRENEWQKWFEGNPWVLGSDCVRILDDRRIDTQNVADYLVKSYDGHLDVIEIKLPSEPLWANGRDHDNLVPSSGLVKAITQAQNYQFELEREMNSVKMQERIGGVPIAKPRALLVIGRSDGWLIEHRRAQRLLNAGLNMVQVLTYDQVLHRAQQIISLQDAQEPEQQCPVGDDPFGDL